MINFDKHKKNIAGYSIIVIVFALLFYIVSIDMDPEAVHGKIIQYSSKNQSTNVNHRYDYVDVKIISGKHKGETISVQNIYSGSIKDENSSSGNFAAPGNEVLLKLTEASNGTITSSYILEIVRYKYIYRLSLFFMLLLVLIGGLKGFKSVISLIITGILVLEVMIPLILKGVDPIILSIIICILITVINLRIISGKNKKTTAAILGTIGGLLASGAIALISNTVIKVNGFPDEEIQSLIYASQNSNFNIKGLFFAAIIMGALGAVMDVSISIASSMKEIKDARPEIGMKDLIKSGMNVGQDIMGSMANTLILAYVGGAMYLMLVISSNNIGLSRTINQDILASEVLKALSGSIGLIFSIPLTAVCYAFLTRNKHKVKDKEL
jgi:Predicted multitransmembrane protein